MRGLRVQLASLFFLAVMPGLMAAAGYNFLHYRDTRAVEARRLLARVQLLSAPDGVLLDGIGTLLAQLAKRDDISRAAAAPQQCAHALAAVSASHPEISEIAVYSPEGAVVCSDAGGTARTGNEWTRPWFEHVLEVRGFAVGEYRRNVRSGNPLVEAGFPILRDDGTIGGVIGVGIDLRWLSERFSQLALEEGVVLTLFDSHGTALARFPDPNHLAGRGLAVVAARIAGGSQGIDEEDFFDDNDRIAAFAPLGGRDWHDLTLAIDVDPAQFLASPRWNLLIDLASLFSVVLMGVFAAFHYGGKLFIRPIVELGSIAARLSSGDMTARVGPPYRDNELGRVACAFDTMADALSLRDQELRRANAYKSRVLAVAGHDLRQPLQILAMSHDLIGRGIGNPKLKRHLDRAEQAVERLMRQLDLIATAGRLDENVPLPQLEALPLASLIAAIIAEYAVLAEAKGVRLRAVATNKIAVTDREMLATILRNLVGNAVKYTAKGGVLIGCRKLGEGLAIDVCDTGIGIPEDRLEAVFGEFYQIDPENAGRGLGLAIVKGTAEMLGHRIDVRSCVGRGSRFRVILTRETDRPALRYG